MVLHPSLYKVLSWSFMELIRSELYCLGTRLQKENYCLFRSRTNYTRLKNLIIKNYWSKTFTLCLLDQSNHLSAVVVLLILLLQQYFLIVAIRNSIQPCYNLGKNLTSNKTSVTYTSALKNAKWSYGNT